jgi:hypothetical protein
MPSSALPTATPTPAEEITALNLRLPSLYQRIEKLRVAYVSCSTMCTDARTAWKTAHYACHRYRDDADLAQHYKAQDELAFQNLRGVLDQREGLKGRFETLVKESEWVENRIGELERAEEEEEAGGGRDGYGNGDADADADGNWGRGYPWCDLWEPWDDVW